MIKYKESEILVSDCSYSDGVVMINMPDGSIVCIPEDGATDIERDIIQQIKDDVESRVKEIIQPTLEELKLKYESLTIQYIRINYSQDDENKVMREYLSDLTNETYKAAFESYNSYIIECKAKAHTEIYGEE